MANLFIFYFLSLAFLFHLASSSWWQIGILGSSYLGPNDLKTGEKSICSTLPGLSSGQKKLCMLYLDHMYGVKKGAEVGIFECQNQFKFEKWNCSSLKDHSTMKLLHKIPTKETAFTHAVNSAGLFYAISRLCRNGFLSSCGCSTSRRPRNLKKAYKWTGCGDNMKYGYKFSKEFTDIREKGRKNLFKKKIKTKALINLHNNEVGRRMVYHTSKVKCKCHGVSGSCTTKSCWLQLANFHDIGKLLKNNYNSAKRVRLNFNKKLEVIGRANRSKKDSSPLTLVFSKRSPDYCVITSKFKDVITGTAGRKCSNDTIAENSCDSMCCSGKYTSTTFVEEERCNCVFVWCCNVVCDQCKKTVIQNICLK